MLLLRHDLFDSCVINAERSMGSSDHGSSVWFSLSTFLVKELVYRLASRSVLEIDRHDKEQCLAQCRGITL